MRTHLRVTALAQAGMRAAMQTAMIVGTLAAGFVGQAAAQSYPSQVIRIVVPSAPSTPPDIISRVIANELQNANGWRVIVENKPGAVQTIAGIDVVKQPADGYSIFAMSVPIAAAPAFLAKMPFDVGKDLMPVAKVSTSYNVLVVHPDVAAKSVSELVALLKANPDKMNFSSGGFGTPAHLVGEMFKVETGVKATHVPYQQFPQAIGDLLNGTNQYMFITTLPVTGLIATGKLRALAVTGPKRLEFMKDVPTIVEAGLPQPGRRGLGRLRGQDRYPQRDRRHPEPGDQQGAGETGGSCGPSQGGCRARRRFCRSLWCVAQRAARALGQGGQGRRDQVAAMNARHTDSSDSFRVTLLGTGNPYPSPERFGPSALVEAGGQRLLVDAGRGATIRLWQLKIPISAIDRLLLTHYHSDHTNGVPDLWLTGWLPPVWAGARKTAFRVIGPNRRQTPDGRTGTGLCGRHRYPGHRREGAALGHCGRGRGIRSRWRDL